MISFLLSPLWNKWIFINHFLCCNFPYIISINSSHIPYETGIRALILQMENWKERFYATWPIITWPWSGGIRTWPLVFRFPISHFLLDLVFLWYSLPCYWERNSSPRILSHCPSRSTGTKWALASVSRAMGSCVAEWHCSSSSSSSLKLEASPLPAALSPSWSFPGRGQAEGKWFPAASFV